jgi:cytosine/adenosine deaminase-related metal-dependent hydrolase
VGCSGYESIGMLTRRTLIRGARILTMDPALGDFETGDVLIEGGRIGAVGPSIRVEDADIIDAAGMIAIPGFVDTHRHVWQTQLRTVATDWTLFNYFTQMRSIYSSFYEPGDAYLGNLAGALEALDAGITTIIDHSHIMNSPEHADEAIRGLRDAGIRGIFCYGLFANPSQHPFRMDFDPGWRFDDARRVRRDILSSDDTLLAMGLAPNEVEATPFDASCAEIRFAREIGAHRISCHVAMGNYDRGGRFVERLHGAGLLADDLLFVHGSALTDDEIGHVADAGAGISSTPETELQMGMGHPVAERARARGAAASLGIDIVSNYSGDMFSQMRLQLQAQRAWEHARDGAPPRVLKLKARDVLALATAGGARVAGLDSKVGSLAPGKRADVVLVRTDAIHMVPAIDPVGAVVLNANVGDVDTVLVAGRIVKRAGRLTQIDWPRLAEKLRESSRRIVAGFHSVPLGEIEAFFAPLMVE